ATSRPQIEAGKIRPLAVAAPERSPLLPDVPTLREYGYTQFDAVGWFGMLAPAGTPEPIVQKLAAEVKKVLQMPDVRERLMSLALEPTGGGPEEYKRIIAEHYKYWGEVMKEVGVR